MSKKKVMEVLADMDRLIAAYAFKDTNHQPSSIKLSAIQWKILKDESDRVIRESGGRLNGPIATVDGKPNYRGYTLEHYAK